MGFMASSFQTKDLSSKLQQVLQHPNTLSGFGSLVLHLVLFALLPILPDAAFQDKEPDIRRSVDVVELTPEEQQRLPEFSTPQIDLPPLFSSTPPATSSLPPLPPLPSTQSTTPLPSLDDLFSGPLFQQPLIVPSYPSISTLPPPPSVRITSPPAASTPNRPNANEATPSRNGATPDENATPTPENSDQAATGENPPDNPASTEPETPATPAARSNEEIVAALRQDVQARQRRISLERQMAFSQTGTSRDPNYSAGGSWASWMQSLERWGVDLASVDPSNDKFPKASIEATFPPEACEFVRETLSADYGVVVDPEGKPIGGLTVLRSSGYEYFNNLGGDAVLNGKFDNSTGKNAPFQITVTFPYTGDSCAASGDAAATTPQGG